MNLETPRHDRCLGDRSNRSDDAWFGSNGHRSCIVGQAGRVFVGENVSVPDVSIYVALITAGAGAIGAAIPQVATVVRDVRQAERDRHERRADTRRQACLDLLHAASDLRAQVANAAQYHGGEMGARLAEIRNCAGAVQVHAVSVGLLAPEAPAGPAERVAVAANGLAANAADNTDMNLNQMVTSPDFTEFDGSVETSG
jgi:hypothetical protein